MGKKSYIKSIGFQLIVTMLLVVLLGIGITAGASIIITQSIISDESLAEVRQNTECEAVNMNGWLMQQVAAIDTLANVLTELDDFSPEQQETIFKSVLDQNTACFEVYMGYPDGTATTGSGYVFDYAGGWYAPARGWYKLAMTDTSRTHITTPYIDSQTKELCITVCRAVYRNGELLGVVSADIFVTTLSDMVMETTLNQSGYAMLLNTNSDILVHPDKNFMPDADGNYRSLTDVESGAYAELWNKILNASETAIKYKNSSGVVEYYTVTTLQSTGWFLITALPVHIVNQHITAVITTIILLTLVILTLTGLTIFLIIKNVITKPINNLVKAADNLSNGDTNSHISDDYRGEMGTLARAFQNISNSINEQVRSAQAIAEGDLTVNINVRSERDMLGNALRHLLHSLNEMVSKISDVAGNVKISEYSINNIPDLNAAKREILSDNLSNLISEINIQIKTGANKVNETNIVSESISHDAEIGKAQMDLLIQAVNEITSASQNISTIIKSIDGIAFQTNILALNASVEAARAGQSGVSFAVVADEVRGLASISTKAANESASLIENSIIKAQEGTKIAEATREAFETMITGIIKTNRLVLEINDMMNKQTQIIEHINSGIALLQKMVSRFKLQK